MLKIGEIQTLEILRKTSVGDYLGDGEDDVLLPKKQVPVDAKIGDKIEVFLYRDSEDRIIATTNRPKITIGEIAMLEVKDITKIGAFMDWGLERDLFLPFKKQTQKIQIGNSYMVSLYLDKSNRLCATMDIYKLLQCDSNYSIGDTVKGTIYSIKRDFGAFVAVDNKYHGLISNKEFYGDCHCGDIVDARVINIKEDGKLDLSIRQPAYIQMDLDSETILKYMDTHEGELLLNDSSSPEQIKSILNMSKNSFKRALGKLLKQKKIKFTDRGVKKIDEAK